MAIEFHPKCEDCIAHKEMGEEFLHVEMGEADVLQDILRIFERLLDNGEITMSATDLTDFKSLKEKVEDL